jgi:Family of unknown function (DUF6335)
MARKQKSESEEFVDVGRAESEIVEPDAEVKEEFSEASRLVGGRQQLIEELRDHHSTSPALSGGDLDAAWDQADAGEETVGGSNPTPDQDIVDDLGRAVGITYEDDEPLHTTEKLEERDRHRWELDPASSEGYDKRIKHEGEYEEQ